MFSLPATMYSMIWWITLVSDQRLASRQLRSVLDRDCLSNERAFSYYFVTRGNCRSCRCHNGPGRKLGPMCSRTQAQSTVVQDNAPPSLLATTELIFSNEAFLSECHPKRVVFRNIFVKRVAILPVLGRRWL